MEILVLISWGIVFIKFNNPGRVFSTLPETKEPIAHGKIPVKCTVLWDSGQSCSKNWRNGNLWIEFPGAEH